MNKRSKEYFTDQEVSEFEHLKQFCRKIVPSIEQEVFDFMKEKLTFRRFRSKEMIIRKGEVQHNLYFLHRGFARGFYVKEEGEECTFRFVAEDDWVTEYVCFLERTPSIYNFQALEDCTCVAMSYELMQELYDRFRSMQVFGRLIAENILILQHKRIESFLFLNAEERYIRFRETRLDIYHKVSVSHLSTYLGMKRQSLSRIRRKLSQGG